MALMLPAVIGTAQATPAPVEIGTLGGAYLPYAEPRDINEQGQVVGFSNTAALGRPFSWTAAGGIVDLGSACNDRGGLATYVADSGHVLGVDNCAASAGFGDAYADRAFSWSPSQGLSLLGPAYGEETVVYDIDAASGRAVGYSCRQDGFVDCRAFSWTASGGTVEMNAGMECFPYDVNSAGQAVGYCGTQAFIWTATGGMSFLAPVSPGDACYAQAISEAGQVVGNCTNTSGRFGFSWTPSGGMVAITIAGSSDVYATSVNGLGQVGGNAVFPTKERAWAWMAGGGVVQIDPGNGIDSSLYGLTGNGYFVGLATQVKPSKGVEYAFAWSQAQGLVPLVLPNGGNSRPRDWNQRGQVVGMATKAGGAQRGFSWTPEGGIVELPPVPGASPSAETSDALVVNDRGQVAGISYLQDAATQLWRYAATLWNTRPLGRVPLLFAVPDVTGDGVGEVAVLRAQPTRAELRSGADGQLLRTMAFFGDGYEPMDAVMLPDSDGDGAPELAVLASRSSDGRGVVEMRNLAGAEAPRLVWFAAGQAPVALAGLGDADGNGVSEVAVLSIRNSDGRGLVEVKNAFGATGPRSIWVGAGLTPGTLEAVPDADGNGVPEVAVLSRRDSDGRIVVEVKNAAGATNPKSVWFMAGNTAIDLAVIDDADGNTVPELAVLSKRNGDGRLVAEVKNAAGASNPRAVWFAAGHTGLALAGLGDADGDTVPELAVLSRRAGDGRVLVEVKNAAGATNPRSLWYPDGFTASELAMLGDADGNGVVEAGVLLVRDSDGRVLVQGRNAAGPQAPRNYWFSP